MRRLIDNDYLTLLFRIAVGGVFIVASYYKIIQPADFAKSIWYYHLSPGSLINLTALILPWLELVCGVCLILGLWYRGAVVWVNVMTIMFIIALATAVARGLDIDCGCFKAAQADGGNTLTALLEDIPLVVMVVQLWFSRSKRWQIDR